MPALPVLRAGALLFAVCSGMCVCVRACVLQRPWDTPFFRDGGGYASDYGKFFLGWYSDALIGHAKAVLDQANRVFAGTGVVIAGKVRKSRAERGGEGRV